MPGTRRFQGAGACPRCGTRGVHVIQEEDFRRRPPTRRDVEDVAHIFLALHETQPNLGTLSAGPPENEGRERPTGKARDRPPHERGKVESPLEIFERQDRDRNDDRPETARKTVAPLSEDGFQQPFRQGFRGNGLPGVLRGPDPLPDAPLVGEQRAGEIEGRRSRAGRAKRESSAGAAVPREGPAAWALLPAICGPASDGSVGKIALRNRKKRGQAAELGQEPRRLPPQEPRREPVPGISGWKPVPRTPCVRGRWRSRSRLRNRGTGRPT